MEAIGIMQANSNIILPIYMWLQVPLDDRILLTNKKRKVKEMKRTTTN